MEVQEISWVWLGHNHSFFLFLCFFLKNMFMNQSQDFSSLGPLSSFYTLEEQQRLQCSFKGSQGWVEANALLNPWQFFFQLPRESNRDTVETVCSSGPTSLFYTSQTPTFLPHRSPSGPQRTEGFTFIPRLHHQHHFTSFTNVLSGNALLPPLVVFTQKLFIEHTLFSWIRCRRWGDVQDKPDPALRGFTVYRIQNADPDSLGEMGERDVKKVVGQGWDQRTKRKGDGARDKLRVRLSGTTEVLMSLHFRVWKSLES